MAEALKVKPTIEQELKKKYGLEDFEIKNLKDMAKRANMPLGMLVEYIKRYPGAKITEMKGIELSKEINQLKEKMANAKGHPSVQQQLKAEIDRKVEESEIVRFCLFNNATVMKLKGMKIK